MRRGPTILAALLIVVGGVWALQGAGQLGGSFMTGAREWLWIGLACVVAGVVLLVYARRPPPMAPPRL